MADKEAPSRLSPPSLEPDCAWEPMTPGSPVPVGALFPGVKLDGDEAYIGRVDGGNGYFIGTAIPERSTCIFLDKNLEIKSSSSYEILTITPGFGAPLSFVDVSSKEVENQDLFPAGIDDEKEAVLYAGRYIDSKNNTYYGWMHEDLKKLFIPRDASQGPQVIEKDFSVLMHYGIHMICRGCPTPLDL